MPADCVLFLLHLPASWASSPWRFAAGAELTLMAHYCGLELLLCAVAVEAAAGAGSTTAV